MRLKDVELRKLKARAKPYKVHDGDGMHLLVHPNGGMYWQLKYRFLGKPKTHSMGVYPEVSLKEARDKRTEARKLIRSGIDPSAERKRTKQLALAESESSLKTISTEWLDGRRKIWTSRHAAKVLRMLEDDIFPPLGARAIADVTPTELLTALRKIEGRDAFYTAHRTQQIVGQIFRYAVASGRAGRDITSDLRGALQPVKSNNYARLSANELPAFLQALSGYDGERQTQNAVMLLMLTFVRSGELRGARWVELDLVKAEWRIPAERMKMRVEHIVPLSRQAVELFRAQQQVTGSFEHVFPNRNRPRACMSENTIIYAIYRLGYHSRTTAHGFRGTASTILHESGFESDVVERKLAHGDRNAVRASYNHAAYLPARREMMQWWADYIEQAKA